MCPVAWDLAGYEVAQVLVTNRNLQDATEDEASSRPLGHYADASCAVACVLRFWFPVIINDTLHAFSVVFNTPYRVSPEWKPHTSSASGQAQGAENDML